MCLRYVRTITDDDPKGIFLFKMKSPNGDEELKNLDEGKEVIDCIHYAFLLNDFHLGTAKEQPDNHIFQLQLKFLTTHTCIICSLDLLLPK